MESQDLAIVFVGVLMVIGGIALYYAGSSDTEIMTFVNAQIPSNETHVDPNSIFGGWHLGGLVLSAVGGVVIVAGAVMEYRAPKEGR